MPLSDSNMYLVYAHVHITSLISAKLPDNVNPLELLMNGKLLTNS